MGECDQDEDTFSFISMNWKQYFIENGQKQGNWGMHNARKISRLCFKIWNSFLKFVWCVEAEQNNNNKQNSDSSHFY